MVTLWWLLTFCILPGTLAPTEMLSSMAPSAPRPIASPVCLDTSVWVTGSYSNFGHWDVTPAGHLAFAARLRGGVDVYDVTNPSAPVLLDNFFTGGTVLDVAVSGTRAYLADADHPSYNRGVTVLDISDPANLVEVGLNTAPQNSQALFLKDSLLYVGDGTVPGTLWIMSLSNPDSPEVIATYPTPHHVKSVQVVDTLAYLALAQDGMAVLNVAQPAQPQLLGSYPSLSAAYDIFVVDTVAYVANLTFGVALVNVGNPASPSLLSTYNTPGSANEIEVYEGYAHVADIDSGYLILDVSNPLAPSFVQKVETSDRMLGLSVRHPRTFAADDKAFTVFQFDSLGTCGDALQGPCEACDDGNFVRGDGCGDCLTEPYMRACEVAAVQTPGEAQSVLLVDSLMYVADGAAGVFIYNVRYGGPPALLGGHDTPGSARRVAVLGPLAAVADGPGGLILVDVSNPAQPTRLGRFATATEARDVELKDSIAYVACAGRLYALNVARPGIPESLAVILNTGEGLDLDLLGNRAYSAGGADGLYIFDLSAAASPVLLGHDDPGDYIEGVAVHGDTVYLARNLSGVLTLRVHPAGGTSVIHSLPTQRARDVARYDRWLYVADHANGIVVYDLTLPQAPVQVATLSPTFCCSIHSVHADSYRTYMVQPQAVTVTAWSVQGSYWCGNGQLESGEHCDDSNFVSGDLCDPCCQLPSPVPVCGNGQIEYPEECDDGNLISGDGCDPACLREPAVCGNGMVEYPEPCDDGNLDPADGCNNQCEPAPWCGDTVVQVPEECDPGDRAPGDGCDANCQYEHTCGDGNLESGEECDDGNQASLDGCSPDCRVEQCLITVRGDVNGSGTVTSADIITLINYVFKGGVPPVPCEGAGDNNCSGAVTSADIIGLVNYVFRQGGYPCDICKNSPLAIDCL